MNDFFTCPASWLFKKIFSLSVFSLEAKLLDDTSLGNLYHRILERLFIRIREEDARFYPAHLEQYFSWARDYAQDEAKNHPAFQGPLAVPLVVSQVDTIAGRLRRVLVTEAEKLPGYAVSDYIEKYLGFIKDDMLFFGKIDRVSISADEEPVIIDYKTGRTPKKSDCAESPASAMKDFQMAMYVRLYEEAVHVPVGGAFFFSIHKHSPQSVFAKPAKSSAESPREKFAPTMDAFEKYAEKFAGAVKALNFTAREVRFETCLKCIYKTVCRATYSLNSREAAHARD
jgi:RecB family exonuclease